METVSIVRACRKDIPLLAEYRYNMFADMAPQEDLSGIHDTFVASVERFYAERLDNPDELTLFAWENGSAIGCGSIIFEARPPNVKNSATLAGYILNIYVRPDYRRKGVATAIMRALEAEARKRGVKKIGLHASKTGAHVYLRLGYCPKENYMESMLPEA